MKTKNSSFQFGITYRFLIVFLLISFSFKSNAQSHKITGKVTDEKAQPLPYASVILKNHPIGVCTNEEGEFELNLPELFTTDSLIISFIGYNNHQQGISLKDTLSPFALQLKQQNVVLEDVIVLPQDITGKKILVEAIKKLRTNYHKNFYLEGFYREEAYIGEKLGRLIEAATAMKLRSIDFDARRDKLSVYELRQSDDQLNKMNWFHKKITKATYYMVNGQKYISNGLYELLQRNYPLTRSELKKYSIKITKLIENGEEKIYVINCKDKKFTNNIIGYDFHISNKDYSIKQMSSYFKDITKKEPNNNFSYSRVEFRKIEDKYIPTLFLHEGYGGGKEDRLYSSSESGKKEIQFVRQTFLTNNWSGKMGKNRKKFNSSKLSPYTWFSDLEFPYHPEFWKTYNMIQLNTIENTKLEDITRETSLEEQFSANGAEE